VGGDHGRVVRPGVSCGPNLLFHPGGEAVWRVSSRRAHEEAHPGLAQPREHAASEPSAQFQRRVLLEHVAPDPLCHGLGVLVVTDQRVEVEFAAPYEGGHVGTTRGADDDLGVVGPPVTCQLEGHEGGQLESSTGNPATAEDQANAAHRLQSIGENPLLATVSWMFIRPLRLPSDRAALSEFLEVQARRGLPVLSENKHALIEYGDDRPGTGLVAETEHGAIAAYLGLAPAAEGGWAMEIVTAEPDPTPLVDAAVREVGERGGGQLRWW